MFNKEIAEFIMKHPNTEVTIKYSPTIVEKPGITIRFKMLVYDDVGGVEMGASEARWIHVSEFDLADEFFENTYPVHDILENLYSDNLNALKEEKV